MTALELLAAWYWRGGLGSVLVCTHQLVVPDYAHGKLAAHGYRPESAAVWLPTASTWLSDAWIEATVWLGTQAAGMRSIVLYVPQSAAPCMLARGLLRTGRLLVEHDLLDVTTHRASQCDPSPASYISAKILAAPGLIAEPEMRAGVIWTGPR